MPSFVLLKQLQQVIDRFYVNRRVILKESKVTWQLEKKHFTQPEWSQESPVTLWQTN